MGFVPLTQQVRRFQRRARQAGMLAKAFRFQYAPIAAHLIPTRRCNLSCAYCNEYDDHSAPVPTADLVRRIDLLAAVLHPRRLAVADGDDDGTGDRLARIVVGRSPHDEHLGLGRRDVEEVALRLGRVQLQGEAAEAPPRSPAVVAERDRAGSGRRRLGLDRGGLPTLADPAVRKRHAPHDHGDGKPQRVRGHLWGNRVARKAAARGARSYTGPKAVC
jgi:hypothetical protein